MEYIEIEKDLIPYRFDIAIKGKTYTLEIHYNVENDYFTVDLYRNGQLVIAGAKIVYGRPLFDAHRYLDVPPVQIVPLDLSGQTDRVTWDNLNETVFLWLVNEDG
jgi:hypothetical protein